LENEKVAGFSFDIAKGVMLLMLKEKDMSSESPSISKKFTIKLIDFANYQEDNDDQIISDELISVNVTEEDFIGRLRSKLFLMIDGYIYYNNNVYKIRYDLIYQKSVLK
jgi:hypothetical protein